MSRVPIVDASPGAIAAADIAAAAQLACLLEATAPKPEASSLLSGRKAMT